MRVQRGGKKLGRERGERENRETTWKGVKPIKSDDVLKEWK